jgi:hypothetical protein
VQPGTADSNAARSSVAAQYLNHCSGIWIVAPITRAVDDKCAQDLMGTAFKRQLQLNGNISNVAFICSKTDDISPTEVMKNFGNKAKEAIFLRKDIKSLKAQHQTNKRAADAIDGEIEELDKQYNEHDREISALRRAISAPRDNGNTIGGEKRRGTRIEGNIARKKSKKAHISSDDGLASSSEAEGEEEEVEEQDEADEPNIIINNKIMTKYEAFQTFIQLQCANEDRRKEQKRLEREVREMREAIEENTRHCTRQELKLRQTCIQYRNDYSRPFIKRQFAAGIRM